MRGIGGFIVKVEKHIQDEISLGTVTLKIDSQINHLRNAITEGEIHALPLGFSHDDISVGCKIIFDPRITEQSNKKGVFSLSKHVVSEKEKLYHVPYLQKTNFAFAVKGNSGNWINVSDHDILKPIEVPQFHKDEFGLLYKNPSYDNMQEGFGVMHLPTQKSESLGFLKGEECYFKKGIEWAIELDGEKFFAIRNRYVFTTKKILDDVL